MNYRRTLLISSVALLILGAIRCLGTLPALGDYGALIGQLGALGVGALVCDLLTTVGAVASGVAVESAEVSAVAAGAVEVLSTAVCAPQPASSSAAHRAGKIRFIMISFPFG